MSDNWREGGSALRGARDVRLTQGASQVPLLPPRFLLEPNNSAWHKEVLSKYLLNAFNDCFRSKMGEVKWD